MKDVVGFQDSRKRTRKEVGEVGEGGKTSPNMKTRAAEGQVLVANRQGVKRRVGDPQIFVFGQGLYRL